DTLFAILLLIGLSPLLLGIAFMLWIQNRRTPFFTQVRPGENAQLFTIYKFKTMRDTRDAAEELLPDFKRMTPLGKIIRKLSLDELPQLWNVVRGEMSFVGPRPLLPEYLPLYTEEQNKRHHVKPGITGWAQVNGRNALSWQEKFKLDVYYVENQSFVLDLNILIKTVGKVILPKDINAGEQLTMEPFNGKN
ncbi:MAG: sugar transferase, partial [Flavobacteriaceae bacterium]